MIQKMSATEKKLFRQKMAEIDKVDAGNGETPPPTVRLTSIYLPQNGCKFAATPDAQTKKIMVARTTLMSELVFATIKFGMASLEVSPEFAANF